MTSLSIRPATDQDMVAVTDIYGAAVRDHNASWEWTPPDLADMRARRDGVLSRGLPYLVACRGDLVIGFAYLGPFRLRRAYDWSLENSVYVNPEAQGLGAGRELMTTLIDWAEANDYRQMLAVIGDGAGGASVPFHRRLGFIEAGTIPHMGWKAGAWRDLVLMYRSLGPGDTQPPRHRLDADS
ncbi:N-acetyltransferase family protein [Parvularcula sp. LCG005]|uniref:GNAT family N-acetyltransferase n=1 Tax=Parvularcula sp. LCG005 TaxID=3078805 RepID=UPI002943D9C4|nr:N-acetyltransferase family protein [Parvularcula sp. LCG005]WOI53703.1 N-acetyltransferase family protein [Parvularcula sp. LCG005]